LTCSLIVQVNIGKKWKDVIDYNDKITYTFHVCLQILPLFGLHSTFFKKKTLVRKYQVFALSSLQLDASHKQDDSRREKPSRGGRYTV
jgi:hypothetical protein